MRRATFLLAKDPTVDHGGDIALSRLVMRIARESMSVDSIALSRRPEPSPDADVTRISKPPVSASRLVARSLLNRRSTVHERFDVPALRAEIERRDPDLFVAEHNYMTESFLRSSHRGRTPLYLNTVNSESLIFREIRGLPGRLEAVRILADEVRTARAAVSVGVYDSDEAEMYRSRGVPRVSWLDLTLPPAAQAPVAATGTRLVFLGDRTWPPNHEAFELIAQWWPDIARGIPGAELVVVGRRRAGDGPRALPEGMTDIGFADDLDAVLESARALVAPVLTGGGVRVKLLESASRGLPVVGTAAALGSHTDIFGIPVADDREQFVQSCRRFLLDRDAAVRESDRLYEVNRSRWEERVPHRRIEEWLAS
ncbi:glycosyltransferase [Microbacterium gilvum]|uniref:Glycosyltransferase n=1 Tax=Microbacterium gilvum TaxID=1336204 RepID=A0ABP9AAE8_9MICO